MAVRLADLLAGLSRLADLGFGLQAGEALRSCALATGLGRPPLERARLALDTFTRGGGDPAGLSGDDLPVGSRVARLTGIAVLFDTIGGVGTWPPWWRPSPTGPAGRWRSGATPTGPAAPWAGPP